jgi:amidase
MDAAELVYAGLARQAELVRSGEVTPAELVEASLQRIERIDPQLNAFRVVFAERARAEAEQAGARLKGGDDRPLLGVPVAIKDDTDVAGEITAFGTGAHGGPAREDAEVVKRLRAAGAIAIGKTNVPELTIWPFTESMTWGVTRNPWNLDRTPGGSSGGTASAVAAGLVGGGLGSDGGGSIRIPAAFCGLYGLKPQRGRISYAPFPEHWHGLSVYGPVVRRVADAALFLDATAGRGPGDADVPPPPDRPFAEAAASAPGRLRIAVSAKVPPGLIAKVSDELLAALHATADLLRSLGHEVTEQDPDYGMATTSFIARYLRGVHDDGVAMARPERLERRTRGMVRLGSLVTAKQLAKARAAEAGQAARIGGVFAGHDVLLTPVTAQTAPVVGRWESRSAPWTFNRMASVCPFTAIWNLTGQPAASIPAGFGRDRLPLAVQLVGRPHDEATLLALSAQIEAARPWADERPSVG